MYKISIIVIVVFAIFMVGCAGTPGTDFVKLETNQLVYGSDTPQSIKQKLGKPYQWKNNRTRNGKQFNWIRYSYLDEGGETGYKDVTAKHSQTFYFYKNKLVGHEYSSTWAEDSTDFDELKVGDIKIGTTTIQQVVELIGKPGGEFVYPFIKKELEKAKVYLYQYDKGSVSNFKIYQEMTIVSYDQNGIVTDVENLNYVQCGLPRVC